MINQQQRLHEYFFDKVSTFPAIWMRGRVKENWRSGFSDDIEEIENTAEKMVIDIKTDTNNSSISEILAIVIEELGARWDREGALYFIQNKLDELTLNQNLQSIWFILQMKFTNCIIGVKRDPDEVQNPASIDKKEEDKKDTTCKLYTDRN